MTRFYDYVEHEITDFIHRCQDIDNSFQKRKISCLTTDSFEVCSHAIKYIDGLVNHTTTYTIDMHIDSDSTISFVSNCIDLVNYIENHQFSFIEYAIDDYLYLDEHFDIIFKKLLQLINNLHSFKIINSDIYNLEKDLISNLPINYTNQIKSCLSSQISSSLIHQTSHLLSSKFNLFLNNDNNDTLDDDTNNECVLTPSYLYSNSLITISSSNSQSYGHIDSSYNNPKTFLHLDKINLHTTSSFYTQLVPLFQTDFNDIQQITHNINDMNIWIEIEKYFLLNITSIWSNKNINIETINPWSSQKFWNLILLFKSSDINIKYEFVFIIQWCFCLLAIQSFNQDWDLFLSKTITNTIISNRWKIIFISNNVHVSNVGYYINQMFFRLARITSVLQYMTILSDQSTDLSKFFTAIIHIKIDDLNKRIEQTFQLLVMWLNQHADAFINGNLLERVLLICKSDQTLITATIDNLNDTLHQLEAAEQTIKLTKTFHSSCQSIANAEMDKFYRRIYTNTVNYFNTFLPATTVQWHEANQQASYIKNACNMFLKPVIGQVESIEIGEKYFVYEPMVSAFIQSWTSALLEKKYRFTDDMIKFLRNDYKYLQDFLSKTISDQELVQALNETPSMQQIPKIISLLNHQDKSGSNTSLSHIPNRDKWLRSRKSSLSCLEFIQSACCCRRRNRVTTDSV